MPSPDAPADLNALLDRYERPLVRYAQSIVGDVDSARDVVQEVFIRYAKSGVPSGESRVASGKNGADAHVPGSARRAGGAASVRRRDFPMSRPARARRRDDRPKVAWE